MIDPLPALAEAETGLARRLAVATGPDREIDLAISGWLQRRFGETTHAYATVEFTGSIDAAVSVVERLLPECPWMVSRLGYDGGVYQGGKAGAYLLWPLTMSFHNVRAFASTPALALCLATMRALQEPVSAPESAGRETK